MQRFSFNHIIPGVLLWTFAAFPAGLSAQMGEKPGFIENLGQWTEKFYYKAELGGNGALFIEQDGFTFNLTTEGEEPHQHSGCTGKRDHHHIKGHAYKMAFSGADFSQSEGRDPGDDYLNYFLGREPDRWKTRVKKYATVFFSNIYPFTDLHLYHSERGIKYDLILRPGADPEKIRIQYEGLDGMHTENGNLILQTSIGPVTELKPIAFYDDADSSLLSCRFTVEGRQIGFAFDDRPESGRTLVIDPQLIFSTYSGSTADNWGFTGTYDGIGNSYSGGIVDGTGYPVSLGAYQQNHAGSWDIGIIKYNPSGTQRLFATYLGGQYSDIPHSMMVNAFDELVVFGTTGSPNFPVSADAFGTSFNGGSPLNYAGIIFPQGTDIFLTTLSADGSHLVASTYMGGSANDGLNFRQRYWSFAQSGNDSLYYNYGDGARGEIITDGQNNVYVGSSTFSTDFPTSANAIQPQNAGKQDGIVFKMDRTLSNLIWSTYYGGSQDDAIYSVDIDQYSDFYFCGGSLSPDLPVSPGAFQTSYQGGSADGFAGRMASDGTVLKNATYFGSTAYDQAYFIRTDKKNSMYLFGQTRAPGSTMIYNAPYHIPNSGQFVAKLNYGMNTRLWSTTIGTGDGKPNISPTAFMVDICGRLYISGWGRIFGNSFINGVFYPWGSVFGTVGMPVTPDALQTNTDGQDFYVAVIGTDACGLEYATFFGETYYPGCSGSGRDHVDGGTSRFDPMGNIVQSVCASCGGCQQFPTHPKPSAWSNANHSTNCNNALFKISLKSDFALANFATPAGGCAPLTVQFENRSRGNSFLWNFGDPGSGATNTSTLPDPVHTYHQAGLYPVELISYLPGSCNGSDTIVRYLLVGSDTTQRLDTFGICLGGSVQIGLIPTPDTTVSYLWWPAGSLSNPLVSNPFAFPGSSTTYFCLVDYGQCADTLIQIVKVIQLSADAGHDTIVCEPWYTLTGSSGWPGSYYHWSSSPGFSDTLNLSAADSLAVVNLAQFSNPVFYLKTYVNEGCAAIDSVSVLFAGVDIETNESWMICAGDTLHLAALELSASGPLTWQWEPQEYILAGSQTPQIVAQPPESTWFYATATSVAGCTDTDSIFVQVSHTAPQLATQNVQCHGDCNGWASVNPAGGIPPYTIQYSNGVTTAHNQQLCPGDYWVTITDSISCDTTVHFTIGEPPEFTVEAILRHITCHGDSSGGIQLNIWGATPPYAFQWSNGMTGPIITDLSAGTYIVAVSDAADCDTMMSFTLHQPEAFRIETETAMVSCHGLADGSIRLDVTGATPPYVIGWSTGASGNQIAGLAAGTYSAVVTDSLNCDTILMIQITEPPAPVFNAQITPVSCHGGNNGRIALSVTGGTPPWHIVWETGDTGRVIANLAAGVYPATIFDANLCHYDSVFVVPGPDQFNIQPVIKPVTCKGWSDGRISVTVSGSNPPYEYTWSNGATVSQIENLAGGIYILTITDAMQCDTVVSFLVAEAQDSLELSIISRNPFCYGDSTGMLRAIAAGGLLPYEYFWSNGETTDSISLLTAGNYSLELTDAGGCKAVATSNLTTPPALLPGFTLNHQTCGGGTPDGSIQTNVGGGLPPYTYLWSDGSTGTSLTGLPAGAYWLLLEDAHLCKKLFQLNILAPLPISAIKTVIPCRCHGDSSGMARVDFAGGTPPLAFGWGDGTSEPIRTSLTAGIYIFEITDNAGCHLSDTITVTQPSPLTISKNVTPAICEGRRNGAIAVEISGGTNPYNVQWSGGFSGLELIHLPKGIYHVFVTDNHGCKISDTVQLREISCELFIPNVITPNGDGYNDFFVITGIEFFQENHLMIYNRWGKKLIEYHSYQNQWDGRNADGEAVSEGVYYYLLKLGDGRQFQGSVTVMR